MADKPETGRTLWDFASEALKSRAAILIAAVLFLFAVIIPILVHVIAEPGSEVVLYGGLVKYNKAKQSDDRSAHVDVSHYYIPERATLTTRQPIPILDRTINVALVNPLVVRVGGANIDIIKIAARTNAGDPITLRATDGYFELVSMGEAYLELEYKGNFFYIALAPAGDDRPFSVGRLSAPTMVLKAAQPDSVLVK